MKKMMFNDRYGLTEAVLQGRKTVTRRVGGKIRGLEDAIRCGYTRFDYKIFGDLWLHNDRENGFLKYEAPYKIGEIVAVAQSYKDAYDSDWTPLTALDYNLAEREDAELLAGWLNKMFVKADLMPHQIRILDVRAERLQDITEEDCLREGIYKDECKTYFNGYAFELTRCVGNCILASQWYKSPKNAFADLIDKISGKGTWQANPYVWRIEFELIN